MMTLLADDLSASTLAIRSLRHRGSSCRLLDSLPVHRPLEIQRTIKSRTVRGGASRADGRSVKESKNGTRRNE